MTRVTLVGGGVMGGAIVEGLLGLTDVQVTIVEADAERARWWRDRGGVEVSDIGAAVADADVLFLAVKPHQVVEVLQSASPKLRPGSLVVSIAAGVPLEVISHHTPEGVNVVRTMPNMPMKVGRGVVGLAAGTGCSPDQVELVASLLRPVATVVPIGEDLMDALTATSGSGPAYVFYLAEAMKQGALDLGIDGDTADTLVAETILGAAMLLAAAPADATGLRAGITSKGGTTQAAIEVLEDADVRGIVARAMCAARDRARELAEDSR